LIYPFRPNDPMRVRGGDTYRVPSRHDPYDLVAEGPEGMEYVVAVASPLPFENLPWYLAPGASSDARDSGDEGDDEDDLDQGVIVGDPYVGMGRLMSRIVPNGREDRVATANTYFYIERRVEYPRYVCADCHHRTFWFDPYVDYCSVVEIRVDATWYRYAPVRYGSARPRYYYRVKPSAPTRYRQWKDQWSSLDGNRTLRERFVLEREAERKRPRDESMRRQTPPEFRGLRRYRPDRFWHGRDQVIPLREREQAKENQGRDGRGRRDESTGPPSNDRQPDRRRDVEERRREEPRDRTPDQRNEPRRREEPRQEERRQQPDERRREEPKQDERRQPDNRQQQNDNRGRSDERGGTRERGR
jgi:hypothetical protein